MTLIRTIIPVLISLSLPPLADAGEAEKEFYRAFYLESAERDHKPAGDAYARAAKLAAEEGAGDLVTQALLGHGRCLAALGDFDAARRAYEGVLARDPDNAEAAAAIKSNARDAGVDPEVRMRMLALVNGLASAPERPVPQVPEGRGRRRVALPGRRTPIRRRPDRAVVRGAARRGSRAGDAAHDRGGGSWTPRSSFPAWSPLRSGT